MALSISNLVRHGHKLLSNEMSSKYFVNASRQLFSPSMLDLDQYGKKREFVKKQYSASEEIFRNKVRQAVENDSTTFTDDLRTMIYLLDNKTEDFDLLNKMIKKYCMQKNLKFGSNLPVNGTLAMRAYHFFNQPKVALDVLKDPELKEFFNQLTTYTILLDLLFNNQMYKEVIDTFDSIKSELNRPLWPSIAVFGACFKQNTPESFQYALDLHIELSNKGVPVSNRNLGFLSVLALNQNKPDVALEIISLHKTPRSPSFRNIKIYANAELERTSEVEIALNKAISSAKPNFKERFFKDVYERIEARLGDQNDNIKKLLAQIKDGGFIEDKTLAEFLCSDITVGFKGTQDNNQRQSQGRFQRQNFNASNSPSQNREKTQRDPVATERRNAGALRQLGEMI